MIEDVQNYQSHQKDKEELQDWYGQEKSKQQWIVVTAQ